MLMMQSSEIATQIESSKIVVCKVVKLLVHLGLHDL